MHGWITPLHKGEPIHYPLDDIHNMLTLDGFQPGTTVWAHQAIQVLGFLICLGVRVRLGRWLDRHATRNGDGVGEIFPARSNQPRSFAKISGFPTAKAKVFARSFPVA